MYSKIKVLLASRPKLLSEVIRYLVSRQPDMEVVSEVLDPPRALACRQGHQRGCGHCHAAPRERGTAYLHPIAGRVCAIKNRDAVGKR